MLPRATRTLKIIDTADGGSSLILSNDFRRAENSYEFYGENNKHLKFTVAGYSQTDEDGYTRQDFLEKLLNLCVSNASRAMQSYFEFKTDFKNKYDPWAVKVIYRLPNSPRDGYHCGWIPREINQQLIAYFSQKEYLYNIEKARATFHTVSDANGTDTGTGKKLLSLKIVLPLDLSDEDLWFPEKTRLELIE